MTTLVSILPARLARDWLATRVGKPRLSRTQTYIDAETSEVRSIGQIIDFVNSFVEFANNFAYLKLNPRSSIAGKTRVYDVDRATSADR